MPIKSKSFSDLPEMSKRLKQIRVEKELKKTFIAQIMGVSEGAVRKWEKGTAEPPLSYLEYLSKTYGCNINWILWGREPVAANLPPPPLAPQEAEGADPEKALMRQLLEAQGQMLKDRERLASLEEENRRLKAEIETLKKWPKIGKAFGVPRATGGESQSQPRGEEPRSELRIE